MAAFAYVALPISGLIAYLAGRDRRVRFHGLQAILLGAAWPALLYAASFVASGLAQVVWIAGIGAWIYLLVTTARGGDPRIPGVADALERAAARGPVEP